MSRIRIRGESWLAIAILLAASAATGSRAAAYTLGGIIYGDANPLAGATVTLIDSGSGATLDARTTGPTGAYAFTVANGLYNLTIDPPASSGYFGSEVKGIAVNGADVTQDVILLQQNNTVNGRVLIVDPDTSETRPLPYAHVYVGHVPWSFLLDVGTDDNGYFEAALTAGTYEFRVYNEYYPGQDPTLPMPALFCVTAATLDVGGSMTQDLRLRFSKVFGKTRGGGSPVADVQLKLDNYDSTYEQWHGVTDTAQSDASGDYTFYAWPGSYQLTALPPVGCGYGLTRVDGLSVTGDMAYDIALAAVAPYRGTIGALDHATSATAPVGNIWAIITTDADPPVELAKTLTDAAGAFEFALSAGTYRVEAHADFFEPPTNPSVPWRFWLPMKTLSLAGDTTEDLVLPIIRVHGRTMGDGVPVGGVALEALYWKNYRDTVDERTTSNGAGEFTLWLTPTNPGELDMTITPPESSDYLEERTTGYSFATHTERDILLTRGAIVHGRLTYDFTDPSESFPVPDGSVKLTVEPPSPGPFYPFFADTDASGNYRKALKPGYYRVGMIASVNDVIPGPDGLGLSDLGHLQLVDDLSYDVHVPVCRLDVRTVDRNGVPVSGIRIDLDSPGGNDWQMEINKQTDGQGTARLYASPAAPVRETITPPAASGFVQTVLEHLPISTNVRQNITMDLRDVAPPKILCGPYVNAITDASALVEWRTDEWSTSVVEYGVTTGLGQSASAPDLSVGHAVRLTGLAPDTRYYWRVLSDDAAHNGPTASDIRQFYTEPLPDTAPPAFTDWPIVHSITDCAATVEWATDEPACGCVDYGVAETLGLTVDVPEFAQRQTVHLTGLTSSTVYFVQATLHDQAGNGPLVSPVLRFETLGANDTAPPVITGGPMAVDVTDTGAAIEWTTNEPATSGVSYNDGTVYGVAQDDALTLGHSVPLSGLTPATTYHCVVSSTDAAGNGPTLSETFDFRTLDAPVTDGPRIIEGPYALGITHKSALIKWTTDRPADSVVEYGLWPTLDRRAAVARMSRNHVVHLTRLQSDARHAFRVSSTDASGGAAQSETLDFYTRASGDPHSGPKILDGPSVIYCGDTEATIAWETNTPCDSVVYYGIDPDLSLQQSDPRPVKRHVVTLAGLEPGQSYVFQVTSTDGSGATVAGGFGGESPAPRAARLDAAPGESGFNTETDPDTQPPAFVVAPTVSDRSATMAVVRWTTDEPADTRVAFGPAGQARDRFAGDPAMDMEHLIVVTRLSPSTNYDLVAASRDAAGNERQSPVLHFSTTAAPDSAAPLFVSGPSGARVSRTQALIQWGTNEHSTSIVEYGLQPDRLDFQESAEGLHTDHAVDLTDLAQDTLYYYRAVTVDPSGNRAQSGILAFSTANSARRWSEYP